MFKVLLCFIQKVAQSSRLSHGKSNHVSIAGLNSSISEKSETIFDSNLLSPGTLKIIFAH